MDSNGNIHKLPAGMTPGDAKAEGYVPIPDHLVNRVTFLTNAKRRAWRELVRGGMGADEALAKVQEQP